MTKSIENITACNESNPLAMDLIGRMNMSEIVNGDMHLLRCRCIGQLKTFDASSWTRGPNFVSSLYLHPYFVYTSNKANTSLHRLAWVFVGRKCNTYPKIHVLAQI